MLKGGRVEQVTRSLVPLVLAGFLGAVVSVTVVNGYEADAAVTVPMVWLYVLLGLTTYYAASLVRRDAIRIVRSYREHVDEALWIVHMKRFYRWEEPWASVAGPYCPKDASGMMPLGRAEDAPPWRRQWTCPLCHLVVSTEATTEERVKGLARGRWNRGEPSDGGVVQGLHIASELMVRHSRHFLTSALQELSRLAREERARTGAALGRLRDRVRRPSKARAKAKAKAKRRRHRRKRR